MRSSIVKTSLEERPREADGAGCHTFVRWFRPTDDQESVHHRFETFDRKVHFGGVGSVDEDVLSSGIPIDAMKELECRSGRVRTP